MKRKLLALLMVMLCSAGLQAKEWRQVAPGIWKHTIGQPDVVTLLSTVKAKPKVSALEDIPEAHFPFAEEELDFEARDGDTFLRFPLKRKEQIYGLGLHFKTVNQRMRSLTLNVDHYKGRDDGFTHAPVPFYVSSRGYGVFIDVARYIKIDVGNRVKKDSKNKPYPWNRTDEFDRWEVIPYSDAIEVRVPTQGVDIYVFGGPTTLNAVQRYNLFNGGGVLPPKWGLGFTHRTPTKYTADQLLQEANEFAKRGFPMDFIGIEPGWHTMAYPSSFVWHKERFPDPEGFIKKLNSQSIKINLWFHPWVSPKSPLYKKLYDLSGSHTVWNGIAPDYTIDKAQQIFKAHMTKNVLSKGVDGFKIDEVDDIRWLWPDGATFPSGLTGEQMHQIYGIMMQTMTAEWYRQKKPAHLWPGTRFQRRRQRTSLCAVQ